MGLWIEIHCDTRIDGRKPGNPLRPICRSHENDVPSAMVKNKAALPKVLANVERRAMRNGWTRSRGQWTCPGCNAAKRRGES